MISMQNLAKERAVKGQEMGIGPSHLTCCKAALSLDPKPQVSRISR